MTPFAAKLRDGGRFLGLGLSTSDFLRLRAGGHVTIDLGAIGVGLWAKDDDGKRSFLQPRDSKIVVIAGDTREDIGDFLRVELP